MKIIVCKNRILRKIFFTATDLGQPFTCCFVYHSSVSIYRYALCIMIKRIWK